MTFSQEEMIYIYTYVIEAWEDRAEALEQKCTACWDTVHDAERTISYDDAYKAYAESRDAGTEIYMASRDLFYTIHYMDHKAYYLAYRDGSAGLRYA